MLVKTTNFVGAFRHEITLLQTFPNTLNNCQNDLNLSILFEMEEMRTREICVKFQRSITSFNRSVWRY